MIEPVCSIKIDRSTSLAVVAGAIVRLSMLAVPTCQQAQASNIVDLDIIASDTAGLACNAAAPTSIVKSQAYAYDVQFARENCVVGRATIF